ncbi:hypothetical protein J6590_091410 [Homalodisca vitripennis]|nr:hypothetical protein J6590_091410 [Homalodisca vitripennis]
MGQLFTPKSLMLSSDITYPRICKRTSWGPGGVAPSEPKATISKTSQELLVSSSSVENFRCNYRIQELSTEMTSSRGHRGRFEKFPLPK